MIAADCEHCGRHYEAEPEREHRLLCGDAFDPDDMARLLARRQLAAVLTDPPYGMRLDADYAKRSPKVVRGKTYRVVQGDDHDFDPVPLFGALDRVAEQWWWGADYYCQRLPTGGSWVVWDKHNAEGLEAPSAAFELCWSRKAHKRIVLRHLWSGYTAREPGQKRVHPTQKPVAVHAEILDRWVARAGVVLDLFAGSGTTIIAAHQTERSALAMEIDPLYCDVVARRWQEHTGLLPVLEATGAVHDLGACQ